MVGRWSGTFGNNTYLNTNYMAAPYSYGYNQDWSKDNYNFYHLQASYFLRIRNPLITCHFCFYLLYFYRCRLGLNVQSA